MALRDIKNRLKKEINKTKFEFHRSALSSKQSKVCNVINRILKPDNSKIHADPQKLNNFFNKTAHRCLSSKTKSQQQTEKLINNLPDIISPFLIHTESYDEVKKAVKVFAKQDMTEHDTMLKLIVHEITDTLS